MGDVVRFPAPPDRDLWPERHFPDEAKWTPDQRHFMNPGSWRMRFDLQLDHYQVTCFEQGVGRTQWRWRVLHIPTGDVLWSPETYPAFKPARRGCWAAKWPGM
jgi:hypothetical protein